jgi:hypothetical protein
MGHAGQAADEGGGQPVGPLPGRVGAGPGQVAGEVVVAGRDVAGDGGGVVEPKRGVCQVRRRSRLPARIVQDGAFG